jgi:hypothetical protein
MPEGTDSSGGAYPRVGGVPHLQRSIVGFIDLLGTSEHATAGNAQQTLERLDEALRLAREFSSIDDYVETFHTSWFSDNLLLAAPLPNTADPLERADQEEIVGYVLMTLVWLQFRLAIEGFFVRGGLVLGDQFSDDEITFGPGLVHAAGIEKYVARFPRVVVDESLFPVIAEHYVHYSPKPEWATENPFNLNLMTAPDDQLFVSYLTMAQEADDANEAHDMLVRHRDEVADQRRQHANDPYLEKYTWLASYHDAFCALFFPDWDEVRVGGVPTDGFAPIHNTL